MSFKGSMKITVPMAMTHSRLLSTNIAEDPVATEYNAGTTYALDDQVYIDAAGEHKIYTSLQNGNTGNDPSDAANSAWWFDTDEWTNAWKCLKFDTGKQTVADDTSGIFYEIDPSQVCTEIGFRGLRCSSVRVVIKNASAVTVYDETKAAEETIDGVNWYVGDKLFTNLPVAANYTIEITIADPSGSDLAACGQIIMGFTHDIGRTLAGTITGMQDFSIKEQDEFGDFTITERGVADTLEFEVDHLTDVSWIVKQILLDSRTNPCLFWSSEELIDWGIFVFGYADDPETLLETNVSSTKIEVIGIAYTVHGLVAA